MLPVVFCKVPIRVMMVLVVIRQRSPHTQLMGVNKNGNDLIEEPECSPGGFKVLDSFRHGAGWFFEG